jgi:hypothetical protein
MAKGLKILNNRIKPKRAVDIKAHAQSGTGGLFSIKLPINLTVCLKIEKSDEVKKS